MLSEPFPCEKLRENIHSLLCKKNIPVVIAGASLPDFDLPGARLINISDENDMEEMVDHLIEEHGFTDIDMLTGYDCIDVSHFRVNGYKKSLEKHGISFDESKVIYGDFWTESGKKLAIPLALMYNGFDVKGRMFEMLQKRPAVSCCRMI